MRTKRIHVVGCGPRTGTTLMAEAIGACFEIDACTEHEANIHATIPPGVRTFLTKNPGDIIKIEPVLRFDPNLYVVYMLRDPRDMIVSRHGRAPDKYYAGLKYWKTNAPIGRKLQAHPRFITVRYEDFVSNPDRVQEALEAAMPFLVKLAPFSRYHEVAQPSASSQYALRGIRPIAPVSVGMWREHLPRVAGQIQLHGSISKDLVEFGYEDDYSWEDELKGIEPDLSPSYLGEYFSEEELKRKQRGKYRAVIECVFRWCGIEPSRVRRSRLWPILSFNGRIAP